jgi:hypothetical protein
VSPEFLGVAVYSAVPSSGRMQLLECKIAPDF